jgi:putative oxidoreductase
VDGLDIGALLLRLVVGGTLIAHGWNHMFGGGRLPGTARWFASIGFRHSRVHALLASVGEVAAGVSLVLGIATALGAAAVVATMLVALVANHRRNGFFIFRPGEGYEYVLMIAVVAAAVGALGPGRVSLDHALGTDLDDWAGLAVAAAGGSLAAALVLASSWRPEAGSD